MSDEETTLPQVVARAAAASMEWYSRNPAVRAGVAAVPVLGGALDALVSTAGANVALDRLLSLVDHLTVEVQRLGAEKLDRSFFESAEGADLLIRAVQESSRTRDDAKRTAIARVVVGAGARERAIDDAETILALVGEMTPSLLQKAVDLFHRPGDDPHGGASGLPTPPWGPNSTFYMKRLEALGLVSEVNVATWGPGNFGQRWEFTSTFHELMQLLGEIQS